MANLKMIVVGGFASGKRTFIDSHFLHKPLIETIGYFIRPTITFGIFTLKYADNDHCHVKISNRYLDRLDSNKLSKISEPNIADKKGRILSFDKFKQLYNYIDNLYVEDHLFYDAPMFNELTIYLNDPFLKIFEITVSNPWSTIDEDIIHLSTSAIVPIS